MKVVLDTNVLIAAFATRGLCEDVLRTVLAEHELVASAFILTELERVLVAKLKMPAARARAVSAFLRDAALIVNPSEPAGRPPRTIPTIGGSSRRRSSAKLMSWSAAIETC